MLPLDGLWQVTSEEGKALKGLKGMQTVVYLLSDAQGIILSKHFYLNSLREGEKTRIWVSPLLQGSSAVLRSMSWGHRVGLDERNFISFPFMC